MHFILFGSSHSWKNLYTALVAAPMCFTKVPGTQQIDEDIIEDTEDKVEDE